MRLIDADELIEHMFLGTEYDSTVADGMEKTEAMCKAFKCGWNDALASVMDYAPTVDAVEVVRCKDCEYWGTKVVYANGERADCLNFNFVTPCEFFCKWGERREDADT